MCPILTDLIVINDMTAQEMLHQFFDILITGSNDPGFFLLKDTFSIFLTLVGDLRGLLYPLQL
jgi:hypothetical protein